MFTFTVNNENLRELPGMTACHGNQGCTTSTVVVRPSKGLGYNLIIMHRDDESCHFHLDPVDSDIIFMWVSSRVVSHCQPGS